MLYLSEEEFLSRYWNKAKNISPTSSMFRGKCYEVYNMSSIFYSVLLFPFLKVKTFFDLDKQKKVRFDLFYIRFTTEENDLTFSEENDLTFSNKIEFGPPSTSNPIEIRKNSISIADVMKNKALLFINTKSGQKEEIRKIDADTLAYITYRSSDSSILLYGIKVVAKTKREIQKR